MSDVASDGLGRRSCLLARQGCSCVRSHARGMILEQATALMHDSRGETLPWSYVCAAAFHWCPDRVECGAAIKHQSNGLVEIATYAAGDYVFLVNKQIEVE